MATSSQRSVTNINPVWKFTLGDPQGAAKLDFDAGDWETVSLPHTHRVFRADMAGFDEHGREIGWYRREIAITPEKLEGKVFLLFQSAMQATTLWVNGERAGEYAISGYDTFHFDITPHLKPGANLLAVRVDNTENDDIPPDGAPKDFVLFGGLYRDVELVFTGKLHITFPWESAQAGIRLTLPEVSEKVAVVKAETTVRNENPQAVEAKLLTQIVDREGNVVAEMRSSQMVGAGEDATFTQTSEPINDPHLWSPDDPYLYKTRTLVGIGDEVTDSLETNLGIRWTRWDRDEGFFLNGKPLKLVGANRHQTWPFVGNAVPNSLHRFDAEQMKAIGLNWVRLSHYPHDPDFLDALDELGLLALAEGPTWRKIPPEPWMSNVEESFRRMIRRDRNRPSIIIWNACVNHHDEHPRLVQAAIEEDPTRERGQDTVRTPMDFEHGRVSGGGSLTIEHTGHTFPTIRGEGGTLREYQVTRRHWEQTGAAYAKQGNYGIAVWCMHDYNTPRGRGNIRPHGVCDIFRIPKLSYYWHTSELVDEPFTHLYPFDEQQQQQICILTNAEAVRLSQSFDGETFEEVGEFHPDPNDPLNHPPIIVEASPEAVAFRAEGLQGGNVVSEHTRHRSGRPTKLLISRDRPEITADGADLNRVVLQLVDENGTIPVDAQDRVEFSVEGAGQLVGESPTTLRSGQVAILVRSGFQPGDITVTAKNLDRPEMPPVTTQFSTAEPTGNIDMPAVAVALPTQASVVSGLDEETKPRGEVENAAAALDIPTLRNVEPGFYAETEPLMVAGFDEVLTIQVKDCEYRIYSSPWTSEPGEIMSGDAVRFRMKAPDQPGAERSAEILIDGVQKTFKVTAKDATEE